MMKRPYVWEFKTAARHQRKYFYLLTVSAKMISIHSLHQRISSY